MKKYFIRYPAAFILTSLLFLVIILCLIFKIPVQFGGILDRIWGKTKPTDKDIKLIPPKNRVDDKGNPIPIEKSDDKGWTQEQEIPIIEPSVFSDPKIITIIHPEKGEVDVELPTGVINKDVEKIIVISPNVYEVKNRDKLTDVSNILEKIKNKDKNKA